MFEGGIKVSPRCSNTNYCKGLQTEPYLGRIFFEDTLGLAIALESLSSSQNYEQLVLNGFKVFALNRCSRYCITWYPNNCKLRFLTCFHLWVSNNKNAAK